MAGNFMLLLRVIKEECERVTHRGVTCPIPPTQTSIATLKTKGHPPIVKDVMLLMDIGRRVKNRR